MSSVQAWEYCEVDEIGDLLYYDGAIGLRQVDRSDLTGNIIDAQTTARRVAHMGALGWDLVTVARYLDEHKFPTTAYFFKRPLKNPDMSGFEDNTEIT